MATPQSKTQLKDYCLRRLGFPVIEINISNEQIDDCIDEALQKFVQFHYDATVRKYIVHQLTLQNIQTRNITLPNEIAFVVSLIPAGVSGNASIEFSDAWNIEWNAYMTLKDISQGGGLLNYVMTQQNLSALQSVLNPQKIVDFNVHSNQLNILSDMNGFSEGDYICMDAYITLDGTTFPDIWNNLWLKKYTTALMKKQWGTNLSKFEGTQLLAGVTLNASNIISDADNQIEKLERELELSYQDPVGFFIG